MIDIAKNPKSLDNFQPAIYGGKRSSPQKPEREKTLQYHPLTLAFTHDNAHLEPQFQHAYFRESLTRIRIAMVVGIFLYGIFGILDAVMVPAQKQIFWIIRYAVVIPMGLAIFVFSFHRAFERWYHPMLAGICLIAGLGIEIMVILADPPAGYSYYAGIILIFIVVHTFFRMGFLWAAACSWTIVIVYEIITLWVVATPIHIFINNNFFFISSAFLCTLAGYAIELNARQRFFTSHMLTLEKEKVHAINADLDRQVKERTRELSNTLDRLHLEMEERLAAQENRLELETALNKRQKIETIGTLAGGIAHDFNNILAAIIGYTELIKVETKESETGQHASQVLMAAMRAKELTSQILTFSRQADQKVAPLAITPVTMEALKLIRASIPATVSIRTELVSKGWILSDPTQIHRIIINLCTNSVQAMADQTGDLEICLEDIDVSEPTENKKQECAPGSWIKLTVRDSGHGMAKEITDKIFDPFFTTRDVDKGTGMGLAVVHGIVRKANGRIRVKSEPNKGTAFTIYLPRVAPPERLSSPSPVASPTVIKGCGEHILVLDDELPLIQMLETALPALGYRVTGFSDPVEALAFIKTRGKELDLVITDFAMPGMTGLDVANEIKKTLPDLPVILCTGHSQSITKEKMKQAGIREFLMKPVTGKTLGEKIRQALDKR